ncbi:MAG TPA: O-antigen ligase family protein [Gemmatimonadales bacterium]|nr:O-antigen ligase family protein [Gemmatimonadales bacterium]
MSPPTPVRTSYQRHRPVADPLRAVTPGGPVGVSAHPVVRWAFYLFVASIPFEYPDRSIPLEITTITGCGFLLATLIQPRRCFEVVPAALWCFGAFLYLFWVAFVLGGGAYPDEALKSFATYLLLVLIFWAAYNLMREDRIATRALLTLGIAVFALALLTVGGAVGLNPDWAKESGRVTLFGQNANRAGLTLGSGALALVGLTYARDRKLLRPRVLVWPLLAVIGLALLQGASRGSLLALVIGLWTFSISGRTAWVKLRNTVVALFAVGLLAWAGWHSPLARKRFERVEQLDLSGREEIFPTAGRMFLERPLTGWGPNQNKYEIAKRLPNSHYTRRDAHNLVLELLTSSGLLGGTPFLVGTALCVWGAWRARRGAHGILPFALALSLLAANMSSNYIAFKLYWLVLAYGAAAGSLVATKHWRPAHVPGLPAHMTARGVRPC